MMIFIEFWIAGRGADLMVLEPVIENDHVEFKLYKVIEGVFKGAGQ